MSSLKAEAASDSPPGSTEKLGSGTDSEEVEPHKS